MKTFQVSRLFVFNDFLFLFDKRFLLLSVGVLLKKWSFANFERLRKKEKEVHEKPLCEFQISYVKVGLGGICFYVKCTWFNCCTEFDFQNPLMSPAKIVSGTEDRETNATLPKVFFMHLSISSSKMLSNFAMFSLRRFYMKYCAINMYHF